MSALTTCPHCGQPLVTGKNRCIHCQGDLLHESISATGASEVGTHGKNRQVHAPRLGEYLLEKGLVEQADLEKALAFQAEQSTESHKLPLGQILIDLDLLDQNTLNQVIIEQILTLQTALEATNLQLKQVDQNQASPTDVQSGQAKSLAQVSQNAITMLTKVETVDEVLEGMVNTFEDAPLVSAILLANPEGMLSLYQNNQKTTSNGSTKGKSDPPEWLTISPEALKKHFNPVEPVLIFNVNSAPDLPVEMLQISRQTGHKSIAMLPVMVGESLAALILLGSHQKGALTTTSLLPYINLVKLFSKTLDRISSHVGLQNRLEVLQILDTISNTIATETDIDKLYQVIRNQITKVIGEVSFLIALYEKDSDHIKIPYAYENYQTLSIPPFPLGEGLTSTIINTAQPLMLVEDTERRARELGAKLVGAPAQSFLGVPLIVSGDVIGAMIIQDDQKEHRFDEEDQQFLSMLASHVAITIRNLHLLEEIQQKARRDRIVSDISAKLWASSDVDAIMRTAIHELSRTLRASKGLIKLELDEGNTNIREMESA